MKNQFLYIFIVIIIFISCKKEGLNYVRGTVVEEGTSTPIAGVKIYLSRYPLFVKDQGVMDSTTTDGSGQYKLDYSKIISKSYYVICNDQNYFNGPKPSVVELKRGKTAINFSLIPRAYIKFRYIKTTSSSNTINGRISDENSTIDYFFPAIRYANAMQPYDTIRRTHMVYGNRYLNIEWGDWDLNATGQPTYSKSDKVFINEGDTITYTISFN